MDMLKDRFINFMEDAFNEEDSKFLGKIWIFLNENRITFWEYIRPYLKKALINTDTYGLTPGYKISDLEYLIDEMKNIIKDMETEITKLKSEPE